MVHPIGVEPITFWSVVKRSIQLSYGCNHIKGKLLLDNNLMVAPNGIEPSTQGFSVPCSTDWATEPKKWRSRRGLNPRSSAWQADVLATAPRDHWLREEDLNLWPLGYEPNELPNCSIPRYKSNWRRKRDSNPCAACTTFRFSRPVPSTRLGYSSKMVPKVGLEPTRGLNLAGF